MTQLNIPTFFFHGFLGLYSDFHFFLKKENGFNQKELLKFIDFYQYAHLSFDSFSKVFLQEIKNLNFGKVNLVGYSMGGRIASYFATQHPEKINKLVLESSSFGLQNNDEKKKRYKNDLELLKNFDFVSWYQQPLFGDLAKHPHFEEMIKSKKRDLDFKLVRKIQENFSVGKQEYLLNKIGNANFLILYIFGGKDNKYKEIGTRLPSHIDKFEIKNSGHNTHFEKQEIFFEKVIDFLFCDRSDTSVF